VNPHHVDPDSTYHPDADSGFLFDADPDPDTSFQMKAQTIEKCTNRLIFQSFWLVICKLMRIRILFRIQLITLMRIQVLIFIPSGCGSGCGSRLPKWCRSGSTTLPYFLCSKSIL